MHRIFECITAALKQLKLTRNLLEMKKYLQLNHIWQHSCVALLLCCEVNIINAESDCDLQVVISNTLYKGVGSFRDS